MDELKRTTHRTGRPFKEDEQETLAHDAGVFRDAVEMLGMTVTHDAERFGVSRQALTKWMRGETPAPRSAYIKMLEATLERMKANTIKMIAERRETEAKIEAIIERKVAARIDEILADRARAGQPHPDGRKD